MFAITGLNGESWPLIAYADYFEPSKHTLDKTMDRRNPAPGVKLSSLQAEKQCYKNDDGCHLLMMVRSVGS
jgi:hypothetical protein